MTNCPVTALKLTLGSGDTAYKNSAKERDKHMEFLKAILGEELYKQFEKAINEYNGKPENKDKQLKLADLGSGEYVSKGKYTSLEAENQTNASKLTEANNLIEQLQKATKDNEGIQNQVTAYQDKVKELEKQLAQTKLDAEIKVGLLAENALDVDYLTYKLKEKGELALDENGKIKGWEDKIAALKTQIPSQFEKTAEKKIIENILPESNSGDKIVTKEEFDKMGYNSRTALRQSNPELYSQLTKG